MSNEVINPYQQFLDDANNPLENGTIQFNTNLTTSIATIYSDEALTIAQDNPYTLDATGRIIGDVRYAGLMRLVIKDQSGATIRTLDNVSTMSDASTDITYSPGGTVGARLDSLNFSTRAEILALTPADWSVGDSVYLNSVGNFILRSGTISDSSTGIQLSSSTWSSASKYWELDSVNFPSVADFLASSPGSDTANIVGYSGTYLTGTSAQILAGPKGAHKRHKTGKTVATTSVPNAANSTEGTSANSNPGYSWTADSVEWKISDETVGNMLAYNLSGGATNETLAFQDAVDSGTKTWLVPYNASGYTINTLTLDDTLFIFEGGSSMNGTQTLSSMGYALDSGTFGGIPTADEMRDKNIEIICGTIRQEQPTSVAGITRSGTSGIVNEVAHGREVGDYVVIQGATPSGYNGTHEVAQVDNVDTYRVLVDSGLTTPATGTITVFGADVWEWIKDSTHEPLGVNDSTPVRSDGSGYGLLIPFTKTYSKVLSVVVGPDETLAGAQGLVIGSSVSTSAIALRASLNKTVAGRVYYNGSAWAVSMGTDQGTIYTTDAPYPYDDIDYTGGNLMLNHSFCLGSDVRLTPHSGGGAVTPYIPIVKTITDNGAIVNFLYVNAGALALYTGAASTNLSLHFTKNSNRLIKFDGSDRSSETKMYFGNIWFFGIMQL